MNDIRREIMQRGRVSKRSGEVLKNDQSENFTLYANLGCDRLKEFEERVELHVELVS